MASKVGLRPAVAVFSNEFVAKSAAFLPANALGI